MIAGPIECPRRRGSLSYGLLIVSLVADPVIVDSVSPGDGVTDVYSQYSPLCMGYGGIEPEGLGQQAQDHADFSLVLIPLHNEKDREYSKRSDHKLRYLVKHSVSFVA